MKSQAKVRARRRRLVVFVGAAVLIGAAACAAKVENKAPEDDVTVKQLTAKDGHHFKGPVQRVIDSARVHGQLNASQEQALDVIARELEEDRDSHRQLREKLRTSAVAVVRSGTADSEQFDQSIDEAVRAFEQHAERNADALEEIHTLLRPEQRAAVAVALRAHITEKLGPRPEDRARQQEGFRRFTAQLMLSSLQIDKLKAMKKELFGEKQQLRPSREELLGLVDAFEGDDFRSALDEFRASRSKILRAHVARAGERTDTVLAVFTAEQRELLADMIQDGPRKVLFGDKAPAEPQRAD